MNQQSSKGFGIAVLVLILVSAVAILMAQGDPCDTAKDPQSCARELPER